VGAGGGADVAGFGAACMVKGAVYHKCAFDSEGPGVGRMAAR
jgi:hypothetical protein